MILLHFNKGEWVHYTPKHGHVENGRIKSVDINAQVAFVVYEPEAGQKDWENYTAKATPTKILGLGKVSPPGVEDEF